MYQESQLEWLSASAQEYAHDYCTNIKNLFRSEEHDSELFVIYDGTHHDSPVCSSRGSGSESRLSQDSLRLTSAICDFSFVVAPIGRRCRILRNVDELHQHLRVEELGEQVYHIRQRHSHGPLLVDRHLFEDFVKAHNLFPRLKDMMLYMGRRSFEVEVSPPRLQYSFSDDGFRELTYCVRYVERNGNEDACSLWSLRQFLVYYRPQPSLWLFVSLPVFLQQHFNEYNAISGEGQTLKAFGLHYLLLRKSLTQWRPYLAYLAILVDDHATRLLLASHKRNTHVPVADFTERQQLKQIEDDILDVLLSLSATLDTVKSLLKCYDCVATARASESDNIYLPKIVASKLEALKDDVSLLQDMAQSLRLKVQSTTQSVSNFLELRSNYSLERLANEAREENLKMGQLAAKSTQDAAAVKVLTIITLIYLPTTVVSNFFSTSFVGTNHTDATNGIFITKDWWIFLAASLPLTLVTLGIWWLWAHLPSQSLQSLRPRLWNIMTQRKSISNQNTPNDAGEIKYYEP